MDRNLRLFADFSKQVLARHGVEFISPINLILLLSLGAEGIRISDIIRRGHYLSSNASYALKTLQQGGYIERLKDPHDGRNAIIRQTEKGRHVAELIMSARNWDNGAAAPLLAGLGAFENSMRLS